MIERMLIIFSHDIHTWVVFSLFTLTLTLFTLYFIFFSIDMIVELSNYYFRHRNRR